MATTTNITEQDPGGRPGRAPTGPADPATQLLPPSIAAAGTDRCANCGSVMAPDQRYCLECGERRGQARFNAPPAATSVSTTTVRGPGPGQPRFSGPTTLIAGIGTLLLAMGIGVLIGRSGNSSSQPGNSKVQVVQLGGSGAASTAATASTPTGSGAGSSRSGKSGRQHGSGSGAKAHSTSAVRTVNAAPPPTVTIGAKGSGKGFQNGHFTGNFFGGG